MSYDIGPLIELLKVLGPFLGVLAAFGLERGYSRYRDRQNRKKLKENLKDELERCESLLTGKGMLLPTMMWNSTVTSGDVKLLSFHERTRLSLIYFEIESHNYEARRVRDTAVVAKTGSRDSLRNGMPTSLAYWNRLSKALLEEEENLKDKISKVLTEPWWTK